MVDVMDTSAHAPLRAAVSAANSSVMILRANRFTAFSNWGPLMVMSTFWERVTREQEPKAVPWKVVGCSTETDSFSE
jgi:hypothetical protein